MPIGLQGVMAPHIGYGVGMGSSGAQYPSYRLWAVPIGLMALYVGHRDAGGRQRLRVWGCGVAGLRGGVAGRRAGKNLGAATGREPGGGGRTDGRMDTELRRCANGGLVPTALCK